MTGVKFKFAPDRVWEIIIKTWIDIAFVPRTYDMTLDLEFIALWHPS